MVESFVECYIQGKEFDPSFLEKETDLNFFKKTKEGNTKTKGKFKNETCPFGYCYLRPSIDSNNENLKIRNLIKILEENDIRVGKHGIEELHIRLDINYDSQCNLEFDPSLLEELGKKKIPLLISCYKI